MNANPITLNGITLRDMLTGTILAAGKPANAYGNTNLASIELSLDAHTLTATATDRFRAHVATVDVENVSGETAKALIGIDDAKKVVTALKTLGRTRRAIPAENVTVTFDSDNASFEIQGMHIEIRLAKSDFPNVAALFNDKTEPVESIDLNPKFLADIAKIPGDGKPRMSFKFNGQKSCVQITVPHDVITWDVLVMPIKPAAC